MIRAFAATVLLLTALGCTALLDYPVGPTENTFELCHDRRDNDVDGVADCAQVSCAPFCEEICTIEPLAGTARVDEDQDGVFDCADMDCDGQCPEDTIDVCADERDQDGDGLTDFADPGCWPFADVRIASCTSVAAVDSTFDFDGPDEAWAHVGDTIRPDPLGHEPGNSFVLDATVPDAIALLASDIPSAVVGLDVTVSAYLDPSRSFLSFELVVADVPRGYLFTAVTNGQQGDGTHPMLSVATIGTDDSFDGGSIGWTDPPGWYELELVMEEAQRLVLHVRNEAGEERRTITTPLARRFGDSQRFHLQLTAGVNTAPLLVVGSVHWQAPAFEPCGVEVPARAHLALGSTYTDAVFAGERLCVLGSGFLGTPQVTYSTDRGVSYPREWQPMIAGNLLGAMPTSDGGIDVLFSTVEGASWAHTLDCESFQSQTPFSPFDTFDGTPIGIGHEGDDVLVVRTTATSTDPGRLSVDRMTRAGEVRETRDLGSVPAGTPSAFVHGNDVVLENLSQVGALSVISAGPHTSTAARDFATVLPSARGGACDELRVSRVSLALDPTPVEPGAVATGLITARCFAAGSGGLVAHRFSVFAP